MSRLFVGTGQVVLRILSLQLTLSYVQNKTVEMSREKKMKQKRIIKC